MRNQIAVVGLTVLLAAFVLADRTMVWSFSFLNNSSYLSNELSFNTLPLSGMVSLNFDDGYASAYENGWPIIKTAGLPSTHYIITRYLDHFGYMTSREVLALARAGAEIGAHSRTHPHLAEIDKYDLPWQIAGSRADLLALGVARVETFAYPYGNHNKLTVEAVKKAGFLGARAFALRLNDVSTDKYLLNHWGVSADDSWPKIKAEIDSAIRDKKWLILVFHRIDEDGNPISVRHKILQQIIDYLRGQKILVVTTAEGLRLLHFGDWAS